MIKSYIAASGGQMFQDSFLTHGFKNPKLNELGFDQLEVMVMLIKLLDASTTRQTYYAFKFYLEEKLNRKLTAPEELAMGEGCLKMVRSEPETKERTDSINYLFQLEFLCV